MTTLTRLICCLGLLGLFGSGTDTRADHWEDPVEAHEVKPWEIDHSRRRRLTRSHFHQPFVTKYHYGVRCYGPTPYGYTPASSAYIPRQHTYRPYRYTPNTAFGTEGYRAEESIMTYP